MAASCSSSTRTTATMSMTTSTLGGPFTSRRRWDVLRRVAMACAICLTFVACASSGLSGKYLTSPGSGYGFEFAGDVVYSLVGDTIGRGTYTLDGSAVRVCFVVMCADLRLDGDCLVQADGARYCKG